MELYSNDQPGTKQSIALPDLEEAEGSGFSMNPNFRIWLDGMNGHFSVNASVSNPNKLRVRANRFGQFH
ncbi:hypothetical protein H5410_003044 [Solanum commersonii]|uniref:Uncharacterized protein n=1 Tax=Solanum commersonii TaxID=4109 RepID=A0A9J6B4L5_SOLCO|nr:hypothetical protein H5410_003044 [Solanum commersonii]